jgi:hypothetical protein
MTNTWTVKGPNWEEYLSPEDNIDVIEIATRGLEQRVKKTKNKTIEFDLGIILEVFHSGMTSDLEHFVVLTSSVLSNAGFHFEAKELEKCISRLSETE